LFKAKAKTKDTTGKSKATKNVLFKANAREKYNKKA